MASKSPVYLATPQLHKDLDPTVKQPEKHLRDPMFLVRCHWSHLGQPVWRP